MTYSERRMAEIEDAMYSIEAALDNLKPFPEYGDWVDALTEVLRDMKIEHEELEARVADMDARDRRAAVREYERSVL